MPSRSPDRGDSSTSRRSKIRFKADSKTERISHEASNRSRSRSPRRHRHKHRRRRRSTSRRPASPAVSTSVSPDTAFRESLFDALADEEGAAYWEGVYGQPIHTYDRPYTEESLRAAGLAGQPAKHDAEGKPILERMDDDEYAAYVRQQMWEKSHQHIVEERERRERIREREREKRKENEKRQRSAHSEWANREQRGRQMRTDGFESKSEMREWRERWEQYVSAWRLLDQEVQRQADHDPDEYTPQRPEPESKKTSTNRAGLKIPFPVQGSSGKDISAEAVQLFFQSMIRAEAVSGTLLGLLKSERVRWHPDKVSQRYGSLPLLDEKTRKQVTAVFQAIDGLYVSLLANRG